MKTNILILNLLLPCLIFGQPKSNQLTGDWIGQNYHCPAGISHNEKVSITQNGNVILAVKITGDECVTAGSKTFSGIWNISTNLFNIEWICGSPQSPNSTNCYGDLKVIDENTLIASSSSGESVTFIRERNQPTKIEDSNIKIKKNSSKSVEVKSKPQIKFISEVKEGIVNIQEDILLKLRSYPNVKATIIDSIQNDTKLSILGYDNNDVIVNSKHGKWLKVKFKEKIGWVWGNYIIPINENIVLKNVLFVVEKSELLPQSFEELNKLVKLMNQNASIKIRLEGHTDKGNSDKADMKWVQFKITRPIFLICW